MAPLPPAERLYRRGLRRTRDDAGAFAAFEAAAGMGHVEATYKAGKHLVYGWGVAKDARRGFALLEKAAAGGSGDAYWQLAYFHQIGKGTRTDPRRALFFAVRGWTLTRSGGCANMAADVYENDLGDARRAFKWRVRGAKAGEVDAMTSLGVAYRYGLGAAQDMKEAVRWYRRAARRRCPHALNNLGICFKNGEGVRRSPRRAFAYRVRAAELGHRLSRVVVAAWTIDGFGVKRDAAKGVAMLPRLARRDPEAARELGDRFLAGDGVPKDPRRGAQWLRNAADRGHHEAMNDLGVCHFYGRGVRKNRRLAVAWYRDAAAKGNGAAWRNLGLCYREGEGVAKNLAQAHRCFAKARESEYPCDEDGSHAV